MLDIQSEHKYIELPEEDFSTKRNFFYIVFFAADETSFTCGALYESMQKRMQERKKKGKPETKIIYVNKLDFDKDDKLIPEKVNKYSELRNIKSSDKIVVFGHGLKFTYTISSDATYLRSDIDNYRTTILGEKLTPHTNGDQKVAIRFHAKQVAYLLSFIPASQKLTISLIVCQGQDFGWALGYHLLKEYNREFLITAVKRDFNRTLLNYIFVNSRFNFLDRGFAHLVNICISYSALVTSLVIVLQSSNSAEDITTFAIFYSLAVISGILSGIGMHINWKIIPKIPHINATKKVVMFQDRKVNHPDDKYSCTLLFKTEYLRQYGKPADQKRVEIFDRLANYRQAENLLFINSVFIYGSLSMITLDAFKGRPLSTTLCDNLSSAETPFPVWALLLLTATVINLIVLYCIILCCARKPQVIVNNTRAEQETRAVPEPDRMQPLLRDGPSF